jgi:hypothetical protein
MGLNMADGHVSSMSVKGLSVSVSKKNDTLSLRFSQVQLLGFLWSRGSTKDRVLWQGLLLKSNYTHTNIWASRSIRHIQQSVLIVSQSSSINMKNEAIQMQPLGQSF